MEDHNVKIIDIDFKKKRVNFTFQYRANEIKVQDLKGDMATMLQKIQAMTEGKHATEESTRLMAIILKMVRNELKS